MSETLHQPAPQVRGLGFTIGTRKFRSKKAAIEEIRDILNVRYRIGEIIFGPDRDLIEDMFFMHPHCGEKSAKGIDGFSVRMNFIENYAKTRGFHVLHPDGTTTDFSFYICLNNKLSALTFQNAARHAVMASIRKFRNDYPSVSCQMCDSHEHELEVHHNEPHTFREIVRRWIELNGHADLETAQIGAKFADSDVRDRFIEFHNRMADLRMICPPCHKRIEAQR